MNLKRHQENCRKRQRQEPGNPELVHAFLHGMSSPLCDYDFVLQIAPIRSLRERLMKGFLIGQAFGAETFVRFFQVAGEVRADFFLLGGVEREPGEALAN